MSERYRTRRNSNPQSSALRGILWFMVVLLAGAACFLIGFFFLSRLYPTGSGPDTLSSPSSGSGIQSTNSTAPSPAVNNQYLAPAPAPSSPSVSTGSNSALSPYSGQTPVAAPPVSNNTQPGFGQQPPAGSSPSTGPTLDPGNGNAPTQKPSSLDGGSSNNSGNNAGSGTGSNQNANGGSSTNSSQGIQNPSSLGGTAGSK